MSFCVSLFDPPITVPPALHGHESTKAWKYQAETLKWVPPSSEVPLTTTPRKLKRAAAKSPHSKFWRSHQRPLHWNVLMKWCNSGKSEPLAIKKKLSKKVQPLAITKLNQLSGANKLKTHKKPGCVIMIQATTDKKESSTSIFRARSRSGPGGRISAYSRFLSSISCVPQNELYIF